MPGDARRRAGPTATATTPSAPWPRSPRHGVPHRLLAGPWAHADPTHRDARARASTSTSSWRRGSTAGCAAPADARTTRLRRLRPLLHPARARPRPARGPVARGCRRCRRPPTATVDLDGPAVAARGPRRRHGRLDRLRRPPAVGAVRRPAARRRPLADVGRRAARPGRSSASPVLRLRVSADAPAASLSVKLCDVFPDGTSALVARGTLDLAFRDGVHGTPAPLVPGREYDVVLDLDACAYAWAPGQPPARQRRRRRLAQHGRAPGTGDAHRPRRRARRCRCWSATSPTPVVRRPAPSTPRRAAEGVDLGDPRRRAAPHHPRPHPRRSPSTPRRTTATPARTTSARSASTAAPSPQTAHAHTTFELDLAGRRRARALGDGRDRHRGRARRRDRDLGAGSATSRSRTGRGTNGCPPGAEGLSRRTAPRCASRPRPGRRRRGWPPRPGRA